MARLIFLSVRACVVIIVYTPELITCIKCPGRKNTLRYRAIERWVYMCVCDVYTIDVPVKGAYLFVQHNNTLNSHSPTDRVGIYYMMVIQFIICVLQYIYSLLYAVVPPPVWHQDYNILRTIMYNTINIYIYSRCVYCVRVLQCTYYMKKMYLFNIYMRHFPVRRLRITADPSRYLLIYLHKIS